MSTDKDKTGRGTSDRPVLFGPPNDPALADRISKLTGASLDTAMARLQTFSDDVFGEDEGDDLNPFGSEGADQDPLTVETPSRPDQIAHEADPEDEAAADGLDRILDTLSDEEEPAPRATTHRSLFDLHAAQVTDEPVLAGPTSPIATVLARSGGAGAGDPDADDPADAEDYLDDAGYDPLSDLDRTEPDVADTADPDLFEEEPDQLEEEQDPLAAELGFPDVDPDFPDDEPDFPDEELDFPDEDALNNTTERASAGPDALADLWADDPDPETARADTQGDDDADSEEGTGADRSYALPEPSPYGDKDGMGGLFSYDEEPVRTPETEEARETESDTEDWMMPHTEEKAEATTPVIPAERSREPVSGSDKPAPAGSALDGLITDLRWGRAAADAPVDNGPIVRTLEEQAEPAQEVADEAPAAARRSLIPSFLRRDGSRPRLGDLSDPPLSAVAKPDPTPAPLPEQEPEADRAELFPEHEPERPEGESPEGDDIGAETGPEMGEAPEGADPARKGSRKRLLAGVALVSVLAAAGAGAWLMSSGPDARLRVADNVLSPVIPVRNPVAQNDTSGAEIPPVTDAAPSWSSPTADGAPEGAAAPLTPADTALAPGGTDVVAAPAEAQVALAEPAPVPPGTEEPVAEPAAEPVAEASITDPTASGTQPDGTGAAADAGQPAPSAEVSDLLAEINRGAQPAAGSPSAEEVAALQSRLADMETMARAAEDRSVELSNELTGLTDQITGLLQRDSDQAERLDRMERLIRGQSAILSQFGQMEESLEQTQVVLLDVSARIGAVEGQNPADRDAVNRALADIESRLQALTANMSILARMSIEGVDALKAPNASSGSVGVQTAPQGPDQRTGGADPVFRTETGGFRISSDAAGRIPAEVKKDDFIEGYGYVLDVLPASDGQRLVVMENGSVLVPAAE